MAGSNNQGDGKIPLPTAVFGLVAAGALGFTVQPIVEIADPIALLITGLLFVAFAFTLTLVILEDPIPARLERPFMILGIAVLVSAAITVGDAWQQQRSISAQCASLQHIMLYEHRRRQDVPEIYRSLGCKAQG